MRCDGCKVWVHAECDKISSNLFKVCPLILICENGYFLSEYELIWWYFHFP